MTAVEGNVNAGFEPVLDAFVAAFDGRPRMGAALAIRHHGELVVDLWGGVADDRDDAPWSRSTLNVIFSCTKGLVSILAARLVQEGRLDYDAPVAEYWPEFAQAGKSGVLVRHVLAHQAGLSAPRSPWTLADALDWTAVTTALAEQEPLWEPGTGHAYHALTHGWLIGEVIRRVTGMRVGDYFAETIAEPLGEEVWIGLPADLDDRVAHLHLGPSSAPVAPATSAVTGEAAWSELALTLGGAFPVELVGPDCGFNLPAVRAAEIPGAGGIASARALAAVWSATITETSGVRILEDSTLEHALAVQSDGRPILDVPPPWPRWGLGFQLDSAARRYLTSAGFGHDGAGGQVGFADPSVGVGFGFLTNQMEATGDDRATSVVDALRRVLTVTDQTPEAHS
jgi:CubicO group peptidase (beta-lactamase class C family)